jgi:preprotein translocase subunit SecF
MKKIVVMASVSILIIGLSFLYFNQEKASGLTILLRCQTELSGNLLINTGLQNNPTQTISLDKACKAGMVKVANYQEEQDIQIVLWQSKNQQAELWIRYADNIQVDRQDGYYAVVKISNVSPFLSNDTI